MFNIPDDCVNHPLAPWNDNEEEDLAEWVMEALEDFYDAD